MARSPCGRLDHLARRANKPYRRAMLRKIILAPRPAASPRPPPADVLVDNVNGYTIARGRAAAPLQRRCGSATTAGCGSCYQRGDRRPDAAALPARRPRPDPDPRPDRRPRPCHGPRHGRAAARPFRHQLARRGAAADRRLCRRQPDAALDRRARLEPGALGSRPLPDRRRSRRRRRRPAGLARAGRRPCRLGEQRGDARGRCHRRHPGAGRRPDRADRRAAPAASSSTMR